MKYALLFSCLWFALQPDPSYAQQLIYDENIPVEKIRIVLEQTRGGTVSDMLSDLEYIPLQGSRGDLIDYISDLAVVEDKLGVITQFNSGGHFYLYDLNTGTLINKITKIDGYKPDSRNRNTLFYNVMEEGGRFVLSTPTPLRVIVDTQGNVQDTLSYKIPEEDEGQRVQQQVSFRPDLTYYYYNGSHNDKRTRRDALALNDSVLIRYSELDTNSYISMLRGDISKPYAGKAYVTFLKHYKLFELQETGISKLYEIIFPLRNTIDFSDSTISSRDYNVFLNYIRANMEKVHQIGRGVAYGDYLIFYVQRWQNPMWLAYNLKTKETYGLNNIVPDKSNDYLSFFDRELFVVGDYIYSMIYPHHVREAKNKSLDERHSISEKTADLEKHNNPILVRFKLK